MTKEDKTIAVLQKDGLNKNEHRDQLGQKLEAVAIELSSFQKDKVIRENPYYICTHYCI